MTLSLGIDTGGTFTDAVIMKGAAQPRLLAKAKAPTTPGDLAIGIADALKAVLTKAECEPGDIGLVSLSTTLATNALVEGQGGRVALVAIGFSKADMQRAGLQDALGEDPLITLQGGHSPHGEEAAPLDLSALQNQNWSGVAGVAIAGLFATRNPAHEIAVRDAIFAQTGLPITCSHELSARLNGPKRALTTLLNARLVPMIGALLAASRASLDSQGISAPLMVVRGDGALVSADFAALRPIETILSGPAASLIGAHFLTGLRDGVVNDIGGTTSDVAVLKDGRPTVDPDGAQVGGHRTMVEAVAMRTYGLGGDSVVTPVFEGLTTRLALGPARHVPLCALLRAHHHLQDHLDARLKAPLVRQEDWVFVWRRGSEAVGIDSSAARLFASITPDPRPLAEVLQGQSQHAALRRLFARGLIGLSSITPTDAAHVLGLNRVWDQSIANKALSLMARCKGADGQRLAPNAEALAHRIMESVARASAEIMLQAAFIEEGEDQQIIANPLVQQALDGTGKNGLVARSITLTAPIIGLGASAHLHHPAAAKRLGTYAVVPDDADVANAIGAVVGQVMQKVERVVSQPSDGVFAVSSHDARFENEVQAFEFAEEIVRAEAVKQARANGAAQVAVQVEREEKRAKVEGRNTLIEAKIYAIASGRPALTG